MEARMIGIAEMCGSDEDVTLQRNYVNAVRRWAMLPVVLPATTDRDECRRQLEAVDVLLLAGGGDIASWRYGQADGGLCGLPNLERDAYELLLMEVALEMKKPVIGICRGLQLINVALGGTLHQDIGDEKRACHSRPDKKWEGVHWIDIEPGSWLATKVGGTRYWVNSTHHQAIDQLAPGLRVTARAEDGTIEAIEGTDGLPIVAVQFHPERLTEFTI